MLALLEAWMEKSREREKKSRERERTTTSIENV